MRWRHGAHLALMWGIRYAPLPWSWKLFAIHTATPRTIVVGIALLPDGQGRWLMLRTRYSGRWIPPGGAMHPGEDPLEGTRRECREELGLDIQSPRLRGLYAERAGGVLYIAFTCAPLTSAPQLSAEHEAWRYMNLNELPWRTRLMATDALTGEAAPVLRNLGRQQ